MHQNIANATFQVIAGDSCGSGFSFLRDDIVVTNYHVVASCCDLQGGCQIHPVVLQTESNEQIGAQILYIEEQNDFAIMKIESPLPTGRVVLQPCHDFLPVRGKRIIFAGYPHGIPQLLTNEAIISSPMEFGRFTIDGMVNGGNSGGPIVDQDSGQVIGIITQRRYLMAEQAEAFSQEIHNLRRHLAMVGQRNSIEIMGVNFAAMADMFGRSLQVVSDMMSLNANTGIGIGFSLEPIIESVTDLSMQ